MSKEIVQHGHCHNCGRVVRYGERTCSEACEAAYERQVKSRKRLMMLTWVAMGFFILIWLLSSFGGAI